MSLYHFNPNDYGEQAFVCAESKDAAIEALKNSSAGENANKSEKAYHQQKIEDMVNCKDKYTIDEIPAGIPVFSEIC